MLDFICVCSVILRGVRGKTTKYKIIKFLPTVGLNLTTLRFIIRTSTKVNRESTKGYSRLKRGKFEASGLNNCKNVASSRHLVSTIGTQASPTMEGRNQVSGRVSVPCWHATPVANAPWKPLIIGEGQVRYQGHEIGGKSDWLGSHC